MTRISILSFFAGTMWMLILIKDTDGTILHISLVSHSSVLLFLCPLNKQNGFFSPYRKSPSAAPASGLPGLCLYHFTFFLLPCPLSSHRHTGFGILLIAVERILCSDNVQNCEARLSCCWNCWWRVWAHGVEFYLPLDIFLNLDVVLVPQFPALTKYPNWIA